MKNFNMTRFGRVLKLDFSEGLKPMMWGTLCMLLLYLFFFWFAHNIGFHSYACKDEIFVRNVCESVGIFGMIAMYIFFLIMASSIYRSEQKKQQRIAWLMLPASNAEKFLSRWIYMLVFSLLGGIIAFLVADCVHMTYLWMAGQPVMDSTSYFFKMWPHTDEWKSWRNILVLYCMLVSIHAFFLLGGVFFKKFHFIATSATFTMVSAIWGTIANSLTRHQVSTGMTIPTREYLLAGFFICLIVLFTWLAYRLFCRWQVVTHKLANV